MSITLSDLKKTYVAPDGSSVPVIDVPEFHLAGGEQAALVGGSGTGKTTLLHLIAGILAPDRGRIIFGADDAKPVAPDAKLSYRSAGSRGAAPESVDLAALSEAQRDVFRGRNIGYVFQTHHLLPGFTALEDVMLGMTFTGRRLEPEWGRHLLQEVGLSERLDYKPEKLSVGQQQRVAVARALANRPRLVLADEPTGALDVKSAQVVLDLIRRLCEEVKASLLMVSHDVNLTRQLPRVVSLAELNRASA